MKLTQADLENKIERVEYSRYGKTMTMCFITMKNGFVSTGKSACIDPAMFDQEMGERIAYENAFEKLWELEGYHAMSKESEE